MTGKPGKKTMNQAKQHLDAGDLNAAVEAALLTVKANPTDERARTFLFELSCFAGNWERAEKQLEVIGHTDVNALIGSQIFKQNLAAERDRLRHFTDGLMPECLLSPPKYIEDLLVANSRIRQKNIKEAREILDRVEEERPAFPCQINGEHYTDFRDYNDLTCCVFEALVKESYTWLPFEHVQAVAFQPPKTLRDLFWRHAIVEMTNGTKGEMFLPALYAGSWESENDQIRLGRMTDWKDLGNELFVGEGQRVFWLDGEEKAMLEIREIEFQHEDNEE